MKLNPIIALIALVFVTSAVYGREIYNDTVEPPVSSTQGSNTTDSVDADKKQRCQEQWRKYRESAACFAPYKLVNGGVKAEAFKHCTVVKQPELCE